MHLKQLVWAVIGLVSMFAVLCIDYQTLCRHAYVLYGALLVSLVIVLLFGRVVNGSQRWLVLGPWHVQTSELAKPVLILVLARYFTEHTPAGTAPLTFRDLLLPVLLVGLPFGLIVKQPNLSTAMVLVVLLGVMALMIGLRAHNPDHPAPARCGRVTAGMDPGAQRLSARTAFNAVESAA